METLIILIAQGVVIGRGVQGLSNMVPILRGNLCEETFIILQLCGDEMCSEHGLTIENTLSSLNPCQNDIS